MNKLKLSEGFRGQERALRLINQILDKDGIAHAYLFLGPGGVGKTEVALAFARSLLGIKKDIHPDLLVLEKQGNTIRIAEVRRLKEWLRYKPYVAERRVALIPEAHLMSIEAANALLKVLEEPPGEVVLILTADTETLPPTVVSRCQVVRFQALPEFEVEEILLQHGVGKEKALQLSWLSEGSPGRALSMAEVDVPSVINKAYSFWEDVTRGDILAVYETAESLEKDANRREAFLAVLEVYIRDMLLYTKGLIEQMRLLPLELAETTVRIGVRDLGRLLRSIEKTRSAFSRNANPLLAQIQLYLEIADALKEGY
ncbi:MAG: ATP-binding protein [Bacillota bacterium]